MKIRPEIATTSPETPWSASLGACVRPDGTFFRVWAPAASEVLVEAEESAPGPVRLARASGGYFEGWARELRPGGLYRYRVDGSGPFPDPASRFQPRGVHGPSQIVDPASFAWSDAGWERPPFSEWVLYELHVGTFSPEGTFAGVIEKLSELRALGATAVELMPVADFPGARNWGYDGTALFAPARCYGTPDQLRALVDAAHARGLAVILDVVYNHLGPDGSVLSAFSPFFTTPAHPSPWGDGINLDGEGSEGVRAFFIENALHWLHEYHLDGLRLDAVHAMTEAGARPFVAELAARARASLPPERPPVLIAEDNRGLARVIRPAEAGGWGLDGVWADDFHHQARRVLAGDRDGYYADFTDRLEDLALILRQGWLHGTPTDGILPERFVFFLQNHDQIGNRARGERLNHQIDAASYRAAAALLLLAPQTPLLFMGQEWGASSPFLYFTDHEPDLGRRVTEGRRREFSRFPAFSDPAARELIPDPQSEETFARSRLDWGERRSPPHDGTLALHQELLRLRREELAGGETRVLLAGADALALHRATARSAFLILIQLRRSSRIALSTLELPDPLARWRPEMTTEEPRFAADSQPVACRLDGPQPDVEFCRPGAAILRAVP